MKIGYIRGSTQEQNTIRQESCGAFGVPGSGVTMAKGGADSGGGHEKAEHGLQYILQKSEEIEP